MVILGGGLTGMSISLSLEREGIPHTVVGGPPGTAPLLGESLNLEGTLHLEEFCGEYADFFGPKTGAAAYIGDHVVHCGFRVSGKAVSRVFYKLLGTEAPSEFHHIDRIALDNAMWDRMCGQRLTQVVDAKTESVAFDTASDRVTEVGLSTGEKLRPRIVFDATNYRRVVAVAADVPVRLLEGPQRVVFTHYHPSGRAPVPQPRPAYDLYTSVVRLYPETDGIDAVAWYIPIKTYLSIGVSFEAGSNELDDDEVLALVDAAYVRRGMPYRERFPERAQVMSMDFRYYAHDRAAGANWMLAGQTFAAVWWMSGAGVGTSFAAARMAPAFVRDPMAVGPRYGTYINDLLPIHDTFAWMAHVPRDEVDVAGMVRFSDGFVRTNVRRMARAAQLAPGRVPRAAGRFLEVAVDREWVLNNFCTVEAVPLAEQTEAVFGRSVGPGAEELVRRLAEVISGRVPLDEADALLAPDVASHLDGLTFKGVQTWKTWVSFLRDQPGTPGLALVEFDVATETDGRVRLDARWRSDAPARPLSEPAAAWYRVEGGRIAEIWTKPDNYTFILGPVTPWRAVRKAGVWTARRRLAQRLRRT